MDSYGRQYCERKTRMLLNAEGLSSLKQPVSVSVSFGTEMYRGANDTLTLWANRRMTGEWKTQIVIESVESNFFCFIKARNCLFEQQKCKHRKKKNNIQQFAHVTQLFYSFYLCYTHIQMLFFTWALTPNWSRVCLLWGQLGPRAYIYSERFPNKYISNCACSMHRNDLHDGMFWSEILHELS